MLRHKSRKNQPPADTGVPGLHQRFLSDAAAALGLFALLERCQQGGVRWVIYDRRTGGQVGLYWPGGFRAKVGGVEMVVSGWRDGLRLARRAAERKD